LHDVVHEEDPLAQRKGGDEQRRVERSRAALLRAQTSHEKRQADGEEWIAGEVEGVRERRHRRISVPDVVVEVEDDVADREGEEARAEQPPRQTQGRPVDRRADDDRGGGRRADGVVDELLAERVPGKDVIEPDQGKPCGQISARERHRTESGGVHVLQLPIGSDDRRT